MNLLIELISQLGTELTVINKGGFLFFIAPIKTFYRQCLENVLVTIFAILCSIGIDY